MVAADGSENSGRAIAYAARLAKTGKADLVVVNVIGQTIPEKLFERFTRAQQEWEAIVAGKRGTVRLSGLLLGSISQKLVSVAAYPVTVVP